MFQRHPIGLSLLLLCSLSLPPAIAQDQPAAKPGEDALGDYVAFAEIGVKIRPPKGFKKADGFIGFASADGNCVIALHEFLGPFDEMSKGYTDGLTLRSREEIKVGNEPGVLVHFEQTQFDTLCGKWSLVFGDAKRTIMVTGTYPKAKAKDVEPAVKAAVLSTQLDALLFTLTASKKLVSCEGARGSLMFTRDGKIPATSPDDPQFVAVTSLNKGQNLSHKGFAERQIQQLPGMKDIRIQSTKEITIDALNGYEVTATAIDQKTGGAMQVYEVILFDDGGYILALGLVGDKHAAEFVPEFKAMAESIRRKKKTEDKPTKEKSADK